LKFNRYFPFKLKFNAFPITNILQVYTRPTSASDFYYLLIFCFEPTDVGCMLCLSMMIRTNKDTRKECFLKEKQISCFFSSHYSSALSINIYNLKCAFSKYFVSDVQVHFICNFYGFSIVYRKMIPSSCIPMFVGITYQLEV
jgi:hypothetical protein